MRTGKRTQYSALRHVNRRSAVQTTLIAGVFALGLACDVKAPSYFKPRIGTGPFDIDPPTFTNPVPLGGTTYPYNISQLFFTVTDPVGSNGAAASGVDYSSVTVTPYPLTIPLPLTRVDTRFTADLSGVADGLLDLRFKASDFRLNLGSYSSSFYKVTTAPVIKYTLPPQPITSSAPSVQFTSAGTVTYPFPQFAGSVIKTINQAGPDNQCGTADDVLWPRGTGPGQVSENTFDISSTVRATGGFNLSWTAYNGVPAGGTQKLAHYCLVTRAQDTAVDGNSVAKPNVGTFVFDHQVTWGPPLPSTGSIAGHVTVNGTENVAGATILAGTATTTTGTDGTYRIDLVTPGTYTVTISGLPANTTCNPSTKTAAVTAGTTVTINFDCTRAAFVITLTGSYHHFTGFSQICLLITTNPPQANAVYLSNITGSGLTDPPNTTGLLDATGKATPRANINNPNMTYTWQITIGGVTASTDVVVTPTQGTC
jgi:hypothetical protein